MRSQLKVFHPVNAHLTVSNLSALANQNTNYKIVAFECNVRGIFRFFDMFNVTPAKRSLRPSGTL